MLFGQLRRFTTIGKLRNTLKFIREGQEIINAHTLAIAALILLLAFAVLPAAAQEFGPGILPADTSFFIYSRGTAHAETAYASNPMVQSWNSPDSAHFRQQGSELCCPPFGLEDEWPPCEIQRGGSRSDIFLSEKTDDAWLSGRSIGLAGESGTPFRETIDWTPTGCF